MKILHLCLSNFYIDNFSYQENIITLQNKLDGHDVQIIASCETYDNNSNLVYISPKQYLNEDGIPVFRVPYRFFLPNCIAKKIRSHPFIYKKIVEFKPDVMLFHGLCGWELLSAARYKRLNPHIKLYVDSHEDRNNSARNFLSREILHKLFYRTIIHYTLPCIDKVLAISIETIDFIKDIYKLPIDIIEFFPLGGTIYPNNIYFKKRTEVRGKLSLSSKDILIVQAGKFNKKKKVLESIHAVNKLKHKHVKLILIGSIQDDIIENFKKNITINKNIKYLGWMKSNELMNYLCAADIYLQPGSQSALLQNSICLRCAVIVDDVPSYKPFVKGNGWLLNDTLKIYDVLSEIVQTPQYLPIMSNKSLKIAKRILDYRKLAARLYA